MVKAEKLAALRQHHIDQRGEWEKEKGHLIAGPPLVCFLLLF